VHTAFCQFFPLSWQNIFCHGKKPTLMSTTNTYERTYIRFDNLSSLWNTNLMKLVCWLASWSHWVTRHHPTDRCTCCWIHHRAHILQQNSPMPAHQSAQRSSQHQMQSKSTHTDDINIYEEKTQTFSECRHNHTCHSTCALSICKALDCDISQTVLRHWPVINWYGRCHKIDAIAYQHWEIFDNGSITITDHLD
jgi:hypothetical protein